MLDLASAGEIATVPLGYSAVESDQEARRQYQRLEVAVAVAVEAVLGKIDALRMVVLVADSVANLAEIEVGIGLALVSVDRSRRGILPAAAAAAVEVVDLG